MFQRAVTDEQFESFMSFVITPADATDRRGVIAIVGEHPRVGAFAAVTDKWPGVLVWSQLPISERLLGRGAEKQAS